MIFIVSDQYAWSSAFEHCNGKSQSPINIDTHKVFYDPRLPPIKLEGYDLTGSPALKLINNGHTCKSRPLNTKCDIFRTIKCHKWNYSHQNSKFLE